MATELGVITDLLLDDNYSSQSVELFKLFVENEQYDITNIREDIEELEDSLIVEHMTSKLKWNNQETKQFIHSLRNIINDKRNITRDVFELNSNDIICINQTILLKQIKSNDQLLTFGFVREHSIKYNDLNIPIPMINYIIIYGFELKISLLSSIVNHDLMVSKYNNTTIKILFVFCIQERFAFFLIL